MIPKNYIMNSSIEETSFNYENTNSNSNESYQSCELQESESSEENETMKAVKSVFIENKKIEEEISFQTKENKSNELFKTEMINKKRGRKGTTNNKKVHSSGDFDNILRKIQVNFLGFIPSFLNDVTDYFTGNKNLFLFKFNYDEKKTVRTEYVEALKNYSIKDLILTIKASPKYKKMKSNNDENNNKQKFEYLCQYGWFNEIVDKKFLDLFYIYYNQKKQLKVVQIGKEKVNLKKAKFFLKKKKKNKKDENRIIEIAETVYLDSFNKKSKMFIIV